MPVDRKDMEASLQAKGFERDPQGHHIFFRHRHNGKLTGIFTKISHTRKMRDISGDLLTQIRRQLRLDRTQEARDLLECPMTEEEYNLHLTKKGLF